MSAATKITLGLSTVNFYLVGSIGFNSPIVVFPQAAIGLTTYPDCAMFRLVHSPPRPEMNMSGKALGLVRNYKTAPQDSFYRRVKIAFSLLRFVA
jgi:hypothetical protein